MNPRLTLAVPFCVGLALTLGACSAPADRDSGDPADTGGLDSGGLDSGGLDSGGLDSGGATDTASDDTGDSGADTAEADPWAAVEAELNARYAARPDAVDGLALIVVDFDGRERFAATRGDFDRSEVIPVASATKLISGLVQLRLISEGRLARTDSTADVLGWTGDHGTMTIDTLNGFVSGLPADSPCEYNPLITLAECVDRFREVDLVGLPGERFEYGSPHQAVAGRMAEVRLDTPWATLFEDAFKKPLGIDDEAVRYVTLPQQNAGRLNPLIAGGLRISTDDYLAALRLIADRGQLDGEPFIDPTLIDRLFINPYADATVGRSPMDGYGFDFRYSFAGWLLCEGPATVCDIYSSPGAYGFSPWVDREHRYYAVLAMDTGDVGGAGYSVPAMEALRPLIEDAL